MVSELVAIVSFVRKNNLTGDIFKDTYRGGHIRAISFHKIKV